MRPALPPLLTDAMLRERLDQAMAGADAADGVWVFAYGSLMWEHRFAWDRDPLVVATGLVRRYSVRDVRSRGTECRPSLTLALGRAAGDCAGVAFRLPADRLDAALWTIWTQEMRGGFYTAEWIDVAGPAGSIRALTFVADPTHPLHVDLPESEQAMLIAAGSGPGGTAAEYLRNTARTMRDRGRPDPYLDRLENAMEQALRIR